MDVEDQSYGSMKFNITAGVIERSRILAFETMLWRVSKGNVFVKTQGIDERMEDPLTGNTLDKDVFIVFFHHFADCNAFKSCCVQ